MPNTYIFVTPQGAYNYFEERYKLGYIVKWIFWLIPINNFLIFILFTVSLFVFASHDRLIRQTLVPLICIVLAVNLCRHMLLATLVWRTGDALKLPYYRYKRTWLHVGGELREVTEEKRSIERNLAIMPNAEMAKYFYTFIVIMWGTFLLLVLVYGGGLAS